MIGNARKIFSKPTDKQSAFSIWIQQDKPMVEPSEGIHLWRIRASSSFEKYLSEAEKKYCQGIKNITEKINYISSQGGLRQIVARYTGCNPLEVVFHRLIYGKPYVTGGPEFNLSHSGGEIFAAFFIRPVGLDVERASRQVNALSLAEKFFTPQEVVQLRSLDDEKRRQFFLRYWVCKEAIVKLAGDGIYHGLRDAHVDFFEKETRGKYREREVWLWEFIPVAGMIAALASWEPIEIKCFLEI